MARHRLHVVANVWCSGLDLSLASGDEGGKMHWPPASALTTRLRRIVTAYQRSYKLQQMRLQAVNKGDRRRRRNEDAVRAREVAKTERRQR